MNRLLPDERPSRVVVEHVGPSVDDGRFPVKRTIGEPVSVTADVFADGHDEIAAVLRYRIVDAPGSNRDAADRDWHELPLEKLDNDRRGARFVVRVLGRYEYTIHAWIDRFASWRDNMSRKWAAAQDVKGELREGAVLVRDAALHIAPGSSTDGGVLVHAPPGTDTPPPPDDRDEMRAWLLRQAEHLESDALGEAERVAVATSPALAAAMTRYAERRGATTCDRVFAVEVERERARFGAWYEMFPRSAGTDPTRGATLDEAARRLPEIAGLGFDVVYLPPIHPIGVSFRKGPNNALVASPADPGSPWAIGSHDGGHTAVDPALGGLAAFDRFVEVARHLGLEVALDLALQASPDHPYVSEHPGWFRHRPDGTIKYAENPPKKYQDIYPFDFEADEWRSLWQAMLDVARFWVDHGVRIFRVDNPHTKPFRFWQWLISEVRRDYPDVVFLSEAFTRPKVMRYLAKVGFSQSYSYFTWRNTKTDLEQYFVELTRSDVREYMRPNLFANTPDILSEYLQRGGRQAFQVRLILAATLGASYGIYSGFELCENLAMAGTEEYVDSEKYQIRVRDWDQPGNIKELIGCINRVRHENRALHGDWSLAFLDTDNGELVAYSKRTDDGTNTIVTVVNIDPFNLQHGWMRVPLADWGLPVRQPYVMHDLLTGERFTWTGEWNYVRLQPGERAAHVFRLELL